MSDASVAFHSRNAVREASEAGLSSALQWYCWGVSKYKQIKNERRFP
jgi:hypothetical protein